MCMCVCASVNAVSRTPVQEMLSATDQSVIVLCNWKLFMIKGEVSGGCYVCPSAIW